MPEDNQNQNQENPAEAIGDLAHCPNCNGPGIRKGKTIACQSCNAAFRYTKEGPKLVELGPFDELAQRVAKLEGIPAPEPAPEPTAPQPPEPDEAQPPEQVPQEEIQSEDDGI